MKTTDRNYIVELRPTRWKLSMQRQIEKLRAPIIVTYGTFETPEFQRHSRNFAAIIEALASGHRFYKRSRTSPSSIRL